jgi:hypothetical protein
VALTMYAALCGGAVTAMPLLNGLEERRQIRKAIRIANRVRYGRRRPRREAFGEPLVGPPVADLLALAGTALGVAAGVGGLRALGAIVALAPMLGVWSALACRVKIRLAIDSVKRFKTALVIMIVPNIPVFVYLARRTVRPAIGTIAIPMVTLAALFYLSATLALAEEQVTSGASIFAERDEQPATYWMAVFTLSSVAIGLVTVLILLPPYAGQPAMSAVLP